MNKILVFFIILLFPLNIFAFLISHNHQIVDLFLDYKKYKQQEVDIIELPDKI